jgi:hypothetical protein
VRLIAFLYSVPWLLPGSVRGVFEFDREWNPGLRIRVSKVPANPFESTYANAGIPSFSFRHSEGEALEEHFTQQLTAEQVRGSVGAWVPNRDLPQSPCDEKFRMELDDLR